MLGREAGEGVAVLLDGLSANALNDGLNGHVVLKEQQGGAR